ERRPTSDARAASQRCQALYDDHSNCAIGRSRTRFCAPGSTADAAAMSTLHYALVTLTTLRAPFLPFLAEEIYQNLVRSVDASAPTSVHHTRYPSVNEGLRDAQLERSMDLTRLVASLGHAARTGAGVRLQQRLPAVRLAAGSTFRELPEWARGLVRAELNVKRVEYARELSEAVRTRAEGNPKILGPKYGKDYPRIRGALQSGQFSVV